MYEAQYEALHGYMCMCVSVFEDSSPVSWRHRQTSVYITADLQLVWGCEKLGPGCVTRRIMYLYLWYIYH